MFLNVFTFLDLAIIFELVLRILVLQNITIDATNIGTDIVYPKVFDIFKNEVLLLDFVFIHEITFNSLLLPLLSIGLHVLFISHLVYLLLLMELELFDYDVFIQILVFPQILCLIELRDISLGWSAHWSEPVRTRIPFHL